jgi:hypothetical protein
MWFDRIWTIQEVALARQVKILSSAREMDYDRFMNEWLDLYEPWFSHVERDPRADLIMARAGVCKVTKGKKYKDPWWPQDWNLMSSLCNVTALASSHPSDKIFALHGVIKELGLSLPEPQYSMDTGEVYWKACAALMDQTCSLKPLILVNGLPWNSKIPSWVPDFNQPYRKTIAGVPITNGVFGEYSFYNTESAFKIIDSSKIIATKAKVIGYVRGRLYQQTGLQSNRSDDVAPCVAELVREDIHTTHVFQNWILASEMLENFTLEDENDFSAIHRLMFNRYSIVQSFQEQGRELELIRLLQASAYNPGPLSQIFQDLVKHFFRQRKTFQDS